MSKFYLGVDPSLTATGVCVLDERGEVAVLTSVTADASGPSVRNRVWRCRSIAAAVILEARAADADVIGDVIAACCIEGYSMGHNQAQHSAIIEAGFAIRDVLADAVDGPLLEVAPSTLKKWACGKGNGDKSAVVSALTKRYGVEFSSDNEADAYALARMAMQIAGGEEPVNDKQREAVATVTAEKIKKPKRARKVA